MTGAYVGVGFKPTRRFGQYPLPALPRKREREKKESHPQRRGRHQCPLPRMRQRIREGGAGRYFAAKQYSSPAPPERLNFL